MAELSRRGLSGRLASVSLREVVAHEPVEQLSLTTATMFPIHGEWLLSDVYDVTVPDDVHLTVHNSIEYNSQVKPK